jgi:Fur family iron response transcriptional regulator
MQNTKAQCLSPQEIEQRLRKAGVQATAQRIAICRYVLCEADHPTAEEVKKWADENFPKLSLATVYNTLNTLVAAGLLREFKFAHMDKVVYDANVEPHFHFVDESTGQVFDLDPCLVQIKTQLASDFAIKDIDVVIRGERKNHHK